MATLIAFDRAEGVAIYVTPNAQRDRVWTAAEFTHPMPELLRSKAERRVIEQWRDERKQLVARYRQAGYRV